jgi:hypothetical protein
LPAWSQGVPLPLQLRSTCARAGVSRSPHARGMRCSRHVPNCAARGRSAYTRDLSLLPALSGCTCSSMRSLSLSLTHSRPQSCVLRAAPAPIPAQGVRMRNLLISALKWQYLSPGRKSGGVESLCAHEVASARVVSPSSRASISSDLHHIVARRSRAEHTRRAAAARPNARGSCPCLPVSRTLVRASFTRGEDCVEALCNLHLGVALHVAPAHRCATQRSATLRGARTQELGNCVHPRKEKNDRQAT